MPTVENNRALTASLSEGFTCTEAAAKSDSLSLILCVEVAYGVHVRNVL
jgi:hypothetical protein